MELILIVLNKEEYLEKILSILVELEVHGATILESEGLGHFLAYEVPIFAGLRRLVGEKKKANKTIFALVEDEEFFSRFKELLAEEKIDFTEPGMGLIASLPVNEAVRSKADIT